MSSDDVRGPRRPRLRRETLRTLQASDERAAQVRGAGETSLCDDTPCLAVQDVITMLPRTHADGGLKGHIWIRQREGEIEIEFDLDQPRRDGRGGDIDPLR